MIIKNKHLAKILLIKKKKSYELPDGRIITIDN